MSSVRESGASLLRVPRGFSFAGISAGIKVKRKDVMLVLSDTPASSAGCFTRSRTRAPSVAWSAGLMGRTDARAIVAVSGNANAMNGPAGERANESVVRAVAAAIDVPMESVLSAATGAIAVPFPSEKVGASAPALAAALSPDPIPAAEAILTTDTRTKVSSREIFLDGQRARVLGIAKGSGMVHPDMATVLGFLLTDAAVAPGALADALRAAVDVSFHMISVDGDTSTNDAVIALANGRSGAAPLSTLDSEHGRTFAAAVREVCVDLAKEVARDGEGARRLVTCTVRGADEPRAARAFARAIIGSNLVKAALFGGDPAPGRVLAALGARAAKEGLALAPADVAITLQGVSTFAAGAPVDYDADALRSRLRGDSASIEVFVGEGAASATAWGCDLSYDYVRINADYAAVVVDSPGGPIRRDGRLDSKTPDLKTEVLVAALEYIERFAGTRAVLRYGPTTLGRRDLALRLAEDVRLLSAAGLRPILIQEGASELVVNSLARSGVRAVGLSGADGNLLRLVRPTTPGRAGPTTEPPWESGDEPPPFRIDSDVVETLLAKGYIPVVVPEITEELEGRPEPVDVDAVAAEIAIACGAKKLIHLCDAPGIVAEGLLVSELSGDELRARLAHGHIDPKVVSRARAAVRALAGGVETVHLIDERVPHNVVAELFTASGVGTMVRL